VPEDASGPGDRGASPRVAGARGSQQAGEGGPAGPPHELVDRRREREFAAPVEAVQELRHEGLEPVRADPPTGLPEDLRGGRHLRAVRPRAAAGPRRGRGRGARWSRRMADHDLIQELAFLGPRGLPVTLPLHGGVLPKAGSRHGSLLGWIGNRDF
jgi:hypothetical protein